MRERQTIQVLVAPLSTVINCPSIVTPYRRLRYYQPSIVTPSRRLRYQSRERGLYSKTACHVILVFLLHSSLHFTTARFGTNSALIAGVGHEEAVGGQRGLEDSADVHVFPRSRCSALSAVCMRAGVFAEVFALVCLRRLRCVCGGVCWCVCGGV